MAQFLARLGRSSALHPIRVIFAWLGVLVLAAGGFIFAGATLSTSFDIPDTPSGKVVAELEEKLPDAAGVAATVVFTTDSDEPFTAAQEQAISRVIADGQSLTNVAQLINPFEAETERESQASEMAQNARDLDAALEQLKNGQVQLAAAEEGLIQAEAAGLVPAEILSQQRAELDAQKTVIADGLAEASSGKEQLATASRLLAHAEGIHTVSSDGAAAIAAVAFDVGQLELPDTSKQALMDHFSEADLAGVSVSFSSEIAQQVPQVLGVGEAVGVAVAALVMIVLMRSFLASSFPLVSAITGVAIAALGSLAFSGVIDMSSITPVLGVMLGLAVGIDYSLFIIYRHRTQLLHGMQPIESIGLANGTAGNAVVFAGATVVVALAALGVTGIPFLGVMGAVGAIAVVIAVMIATTLTPALLGLAGTRIVTAAAKKRHAAKQEKLRQRPPARTMSTKRAVLTTVLGVAILGTVAIPAASMRLGLPDGGSEPVGSPAHTAYTVISEKFGAGLNGGLLVTGELTGTETAAEQLETQLAVADAIGQLDSVTAVAPVAVSPDGTLAAFQVIPEEGPNSESTAALVEALRALPPVGGVTPIDVAGQATINIDISQSLSDALPTYLIVVVGLSLLIMLLAFRSILVPLVATGGFILSLLAAFGAMTAVFQWGWLGEIFGTTSPGPILSFLPVILVGILFGLAMDYQLFLASGMREAWSRGQHAREAVVTGLRSGQAVVTAAALIMVSVFAGFISSHSPIIRSLGFGMAVGVLLDAFVVRLLIMPAIMHMLGTAAWKIPRWVDRILPNVDVEGARLERGHAASAPASEAALVPPRE